MLCVSLHNNIYYIFGGHPSGTSADNVEGPGPGWGGVGSDKGGRRGEGEVKGEISFIY